MMPFKTRFSEQEILALAKYVRAFDKSLASAPAKAKAPAKEEAHRVTHCTRTGGFVSPSSTN